MTKSDHTSLNDGLPPEESTDRSNYSARDATFVCAFVLVKRLTDSGISWFSARM